MLGKRRRFGRLAGRITSGIILLLATAPMALAGSGGSGNGGGGRYNTPPSQWAFSDWYVQGGIGSSQASVNTTSSGLFGGGTQQTTASPVNLKQGGSSTVGVLAGENFTANMQNLNVSNVKVDSFSLWVPKTGQTIQIPVQSNGIGGVTSSAAVLREYSGGTTLQVNQIIPPGSKKGTYYAQILAKAQFQYRYILNNINGLPNTSVTGSCARFLGRNTNFGCWSPPHLVATLTIPIHYTPTTAAPTGCGLDSSMSATNDTTATESNWQPCKVQSFDTPDPTSATLQVPSQVALGQRPVANFSMAGFTWGLTGPNTNTLKPLQNNSGQTFENTSCGTDNGAGNTDCADPNYNKASAVAQLKSIAFNSLTIDWPGAGVTQINPGQTSTNMSGSFSVSGIIGPHANWGNKAGIQVNATASGTATWTVTASDQDANYARGDATDESPTCHKNSKGQQVGDCADGAEGDDDRTDEPITISAKKTWTFTTPWWIQASSVMNEQGSHNYVYPWGGTS